MALFFKDVDLERRLEAVMIGSETSDRKSHAKIQNSLFQTLLPGESLLAVIADVNDRGVLALTHQRVLSGSGRQIDYTIPGDRVAGTALGTKDFYGGKHTKLYVVKVTWLGGQPKHVVHKGVEWRGDCFGVFRWEYDEADPACTLIDHEFNLS